MKNKIFFLFLIILGLSFNTNTFAEKILIKAKNISLDKDKEITIFKNQVFVKTESGYEIECEYAMYNRKTGILILKTNIVGKDLKKNIIKTGFAEYNETTKVFLTKGPTKVITSEKYEINGSNIKFDDIKSFINSKDEATIIDQENNTIYLENFDYNIMIIYLNLLEKLK